MATYDLTKEIPAAADLLADDVLNCTYTGSEITIELPAGRFKLECYGSAGTKAGRYTSLLGGEGGYSYGTLSITETTRFYLNAGGQGTTSTSSSTRNTGGYNGGGYSYYYAGPGGGATHIATASGLLSTLSSSTDSIIIVAGGGGGASSYSSSYSSTYQGKGGKGGGESGEAGYYGSSNTSSNALKYAGQGGTQTAGGAAGTYSSRAGSAGSFGQGGNGGSASSSYYGEGGGGGGAVDVLAYGYYDADNDVFWKDESHVTPWPRSNSKIYIDQSTGMAYSLFDNKYNSFVAVATQDRYGIVKLYGSTGQNVDGTVTQKAFTDALNNIASIEEEILEIKSDF